MELYQKYYSRALQYLSENNPQKAIEHYTLAIQTASTLKWTDIVFVFEKSIELAGLYIETKSEDDYPTRLSALRAFEILGSQPNLLKIDMHFPENLWNLANILYFLKEYPQSARCFNQLSELTDTAEMITECKIRMALCLSYMGETEASTGEIIKVINNPSIKPANLIYATKTLGDILSYHGKYDEAIKKYEDLLASPDIESDPSLMAEIKLNLGLTHYNSGNFSLAFSSFLEVFQWTRQPSSFETERLFIASARNMVDILIKMLSYENLSKYIGLMEEKWLLPNERTELNLLKGILYMNDPGRYAAYYPQVLQLLNSDDLELSPDQLKSVLNFQFLYFSFTGDTDHVRHLAEKITKYNYHTKSPIIENKAVKKSLIFHLLKHKPFGYVRETSLLLKELSDELLIGENHTLSFTWMADIIKYYCILENYETAASLIIHIIKPFRDFLIDYLLARYDDQLFYISKISEFRDTLFDIIKNTNHETACYHSICNLMIELDLKTRYLSVRKEIGFSSFISKQEPGDSDLVKQYVRLKKQQLISGSKANDDLKRELAILESRLKKHPEYLDRFSDLLGIDPSDIWNRLTPEDIALCFIQYEKPSQDFTRIFRYAIYMVNHGSPVPEIKFLHDLDDTTLSEMLPYQIYRDFEQESDFETNILYNIDLNLRNLFDTLIVPVYPIIQNCKRLFIVADGKLNFVPFNALITDDNQFLGEKYEVIRLMSLMDVNKDITPFASDNISLYGGIDYGAGSNPGSVLSQQAKPENISGQADPGLNQLMEKEIRSIYNDLHEKKVNVTSHNDLSIHRLSKEKSKIIHILTHGFFNNDENKNYRFVNVEQFSPLEIYSHPNPLMRSGLVTSGFHSLIQTLSGEDNHDSSEKGVITSYEISRLTLDAQLVTLHACETGLGAVAGNELYGLTRAFKQAGVKYLVVSLWKVPYTDFFIKFYRNLAEMNAMDIRAIFKKTSDEMRMHQPHPFFWAGFVLIE